MSVTFKKSSLLSFVERYFYYDSGYFKRAGESRCIYRAPAKGVRPDILAGDFSFLNACSQSWKFPLSSLRGHSMWPWQSLSCERSRLLRFARNDKEHNPLHKTSLCSAREISHTPAKKPLLRTKNLDGTESPVNNDADLRNTGNLHYALC